MILTYPQLIYFIYDYKGTDMKRFFRFDAIWVLLDVRNYSENGKGGLIKKIGNGGNTDIWDTT